MQPWSWAFLSSKRPVMISFHPLAERLFVPWASCSHRGGKGNNKGSASLRKRINESQIISITSQPPTNSYYVHLHLRTLFPWGTSFQRGWVALPSWFWTWEKCVGSQFVSKDTIWNWPQNGRAELKMGKNIKLRLTHPTPCANPATRKDSLL
jgi:hypothetical protein